MMEGHRMNLHVKLFQDCCSKGHFFLESSFCHLSRPLPVTTEGTDQQAQLLPSHVYICISHQEDFQRPCLGAQTDTHPAGYLPCKFSLYVFFRCRITGDSYSWSHAFVTNVSTVKEGNEICRLTGKPFITQKQRAMRHPSVHPSPPPLPSAGTVCQVGI